jgi:hypothetical protein
LLFEVQQYGNRLIRLSDGRIEFLSTDDPFFVLPGDNRARIDTNGILRDVNFAFPIAP